MLAALVAHRRTIDTRTKRTLVVLGAAIVVADAFAKAAAPAQGLDLTTLFSIMRDLPSAIGFALIVGALATAPRGTVVGGPVLAALVAHRRTIDMRTKRVLVAAGVAIVIADAFTKAAAPAHGLDLTMLFSIMRDVPSAIGFALIVGALAVAPRGAVLGGTAFAALGTISYGFYLWHVPVYMVLRGYGLLPLDPVLGTAAALLPSLALSALSWFVLERPVLRWSARRARRAARLRRRSADGRELGGAGGRELGGREVSAVRT
jgi:peptidoglycan/LPS O-acetylase OafA/YrhL